MPPNPDQKPAADCKAVRFLEDVLWEDRFGGSGLDGCPAVAGRRIRFHHLGPIHLERQETMDVTTRRLVPLLLVAMLAGCGDPGDSGNAVSAGAPRQPQETPLTAVPDKEREIAASRHLEGPTTTEGLSGVDTLVALSLADEFKQMEGQQLRARVLTFAPGAVVAVHQHEARPGFAYILEGEMVEHRNDQEQPIVRRAGDVAVEWTGVSHWWENTSDQQVKALVVDILKPDE